MLTNRTRAAVLALAIMTPVALHAQRGVGGGGRGSVGGGGNPVAPLIDMRRELNLTARQLVQLDSYFRGASCGEIRVTVAVCTLMAASSINLRAVSRRAGRRGIGSG